MTVKINSERQWALNAVAEVGVANIGAGNEIKINLPAGSVLKGLIVLTTTAFNGGTTSTLTVADGTTTFANAVDVSSIGSETVANVPKYYPSAATLTVSAAVTGTAATAGKAIVIAEYVRVGRANEVQE